MSTVLKFVDVGVPIKAAYAQWTQFESFPQFMEGVGEVRQLDDKRLHWAAEIDGQRLEWDAEINEQLPNVRIAWSSTGGAPNGGAIDFHYLGPNRTRVVALMDYEPQNAAQRVGDWLGVLDRRVQGDLDRFKAFIEGRGGHPTGAWTGTIEDHPQSMQPGQPGMSGTPIGGTTAAIPEYGAGAQSLESLGTPPSDLGDDLLVDRPDATI